MARGKGPPLLHTKFHPNRCNDKGIGPPKLKFLLRFDQNVEYKCLAVAYLLHDFHKICSVYITFQDALAVKFRWICTRGYGVMGVFNLRGLVIPNFSAPPGGEIMRQTHKSFRGARTCSRSSITVPSWWGSDFTHSRSGQKR